MLIALKEAPERRNWTQRQWADYLGCSPAAVAAATTQQLVIPVSERHQQPPTLRNIREGLLIVFCMNPPACEWTDEAKWLTHYLQCLAGEGAGQRRQRFQAALDSVDYDPNLIQAIRHYVRQRFGEWDPGTLTATHDWLVAEHGLTVETAWDITAPELLSRLRGERILIIFLGNNQYRSDDEPVVKVSDEQDDFLQAFLDNPPKWKAAARLKTDEIEKRTERTGRTSAIARALKNGPLGPGIDPPGKERKGQGYGVTIRREL
jgi:hypothetical protein